MDKASLKIFVKPPAHMSQAMFRVERALTRYAPPWVEIVQTPRHADLTVLHVIGNDAITAPRLTEHYAVIQYCVGPSLSGFDPAPWQDYWRCAKVVWSYYDYGPHMPKNSTFYLAPLGLDDAFVKAKGLHTREIGVVTSGYVTGCGAEAIEEVAIAADRLGMAVAHLGPLPEYPDHTPALRLEALPLWGFFHSITDDALAVLYQSSKWVSGLRYSEGFELPAAEGLACGARPVLFDRPDMRLWYNDHAVFVPELSGEDLIEKLVQVFTCEPTPVHSAERTWVRERFNWQHIINGFWTALQVTCEETVVGR